MKKEIIIVNPQTIQEQSCIDSISINKHYADCDYNASAMMVYLDSFGLDCGDSLHIAIHHKNGCLPYIASEVITPKTQCEFGSVILQAGGTLTWSTKNEKPGGHFIVEQKLWGKWIKVNETESHAQPCEGETHYEIKAALVHGKNTIRIKKSFGSNSSDPSKEASAVSNLLENTFNYDHKRGILILERPCRYQIRDSNDNILIDGEGNYVDISKIREKEILFYYDNTHEKVILKK